MHDAYMAVIVLYVPQPVQSRRRRFNFGRHRTAYDTVVHRLRYPDDDEPRLLLLLDQWRLHIIIIIIITVVQQQQGREEEICGPPLWGPRGDDVKNHGGDPAV